LPIHRRKKHHTVYAREILQEFFSTEELKTLCADIGIRYDALPTNGKPTTARELVSYCFRHGLLSSLYSAMITARLPTIPGQSELPWIVDFQEFLLNLAGDTQPIRPERSDLDHNGDSGPLKVDYKLLVKIATELAGLRSSIVFIRLQIILLYIAFGVFLVALSFVASRVFW